MPNSEIQLLNVDARLELRNKISREMNGRVLNIPLRHLARDHGKEIFRYSAGQSEEAE
jgi:hypothetical protein